MKKFLMMIPFLFLSSLIFAMSDTSESKNVIWTPAPANFFEFSLYRDDIEINENGNIGLDSVNDALKAEAEVTLKWHIISQSNAFIYMKASESLNASDGSEVPWFIYIDGGEADKKGVGEDLLVASHVASSSLISINASGRKIIIEADLSNVFSSVDDSATLNVEIRSN